MKKIMMISVFTLAALSSFAQTNPDTSNRSLVQYVNSFRSLDLLMADLQKFGYLNSVDRREITEFLNQQKVDIKGPLPLAKVDGDKVMFGAYGWSSLSDHSYKTLRGSIVRPHKDQSLLQIYTTMFNALTEKRVAQFSLMNAAYADDSKAGPAASAFSFVVKHLAGVVVGDIFSPIGSGLAFAHGGLIQGLWAMRAVYIDGLNDMRCTGAGEYVLTSVTEKPAPFSTKVCDLPKETAKDYAVMGHAKAICKFSSSGFEFLDRAYAQKPQAMVVQKDFLKQVFGETIPACTLPNLDKVKEAVRQKLDREIAAAEQKLKATDSAGSASPGHR